VSAYYSGEHGDPVRTRLGRLGYEGVAGKLGVTPTALLQTDTGRIVVGAGAP